MKKLLFIFLSFVACAALQAQPLSVTNQQVPAETAFANPFEARFELSGAVGEVNIDRENLPANFELTQASSRTLSSGALEYELTFLPFTLGPSTFTAVTFYLADNPAQRAVSEEASVKINPVTYFDEKTLRDIRPPYIPASRWWWLASLLVIMLIIYFIRRFVRDVNTKRTEQAQAMPDNRPAEIIALSKIEALLQSGLWEHKQYKLFYTELGDILREYFWRRWNMDVSSDTSAELLRRARGVKELGNSITLLRQFLVSSDLVKFAKLTPADEVMHRDISAARQIIKDTTPRPAPAPEQKEVR